MPFLDLAYALFVGCLNKSPCEYVQTFTALRALDSLQQVQKSSKQSKFWHRGLADFLQLTILSCIKHVLMEPIALESSAVLRNVGLVS